MIYSDFKDLKLSKLGLGCMRLPVKEDKTIDEKQEFDMVDYALKHGINYFDTAWPYHDGLSEIVIGKALKRYPRDSYYLADKYPGHQIASKYDPKDIFEQQLQKCQTDYFDFYLLHNVYENSFDVYEDPKWGIIDYFVEQRKLGRIRHLGFSSHAQVNNLKDFLDRHPGLFEFVQIQLNYVDYSLQEAKKKVELLNSYHLPIIVMEPIRGGKLASLSAEDEQRLKALRPDSSIASWALNFNLSLDGIAVILSGMSDMDQLKDNVETFERNKPLNADEKQVVLEIAETLKKAVPCTKCRYCTAGCPMYIDIPEMIATYNELKMDKRVNAIMWLDSLEADRLPGACLKCGACEKICPQRIAIPEILSELTEIIEGMPSWKQISKEREEAANKLKQK